MLNLITDPWIPARRKNGRCDTISPDRIADPDIVALDWPRPDLTLACLELLIGLAYLACPPVDEDDWLDGPPDAQRLAKGLAPLAPAFNLLGEGPRFMQDMEPLSGAPNPPDMLFIDSAGDSTARKNADLMVRRCRYDRLPLPLAAMALYTLQDFAPSGGAGNRTSMRGGGPMVTLVRPPEPELWAMIWANMPFGVPLGSDGLTRLPWMRPTEVSDAGQIAVPRGDGTGPPDPEVFFGMPRRLRLIGDEAGVTGVVQKPWGTNYQGWLHPLSPYYLHKDDKLPVHPRPGPFGYRNWRGIVFEVEGAVKPPLLDRFHRLRQGEKCDLLVAGWAMSNMSPLDFLWSRQPVFPLSSEAEHIAADMVEAAEQAGIVLASATSQGSGEDDMGTGAGARVRQAFFADTQAPFEAHLAAMTGGIPEGLSESWLETMRKTALGLFKAEVLPGLPGLSPQRQHLAASARARLVAAFAGGASGRKIYKALGLEMPKRKGRGKAA